MATVNPWKKFRRLLGVNHRYIATVTVTDGTTSTVTLRTGEQARVAGTSALGQAVWVESGEIKGDAPTATVINVTI